MTELSTDPIHRCIENWHRHLAGDLDGGFDSLLHDEVTFHSPVVFTPQEGKVITTMYLSAAQVTLGGDGNGFGYTKQILDGHQAMLEFETTMDGKLVNGVDIITCDDNAMITEFRVMVRPLQGLQVVQGQMTAMLESIQPQK